MWGIAWIPHVFLNYIHYIQFHMSGTTTCHVYKHKIRCLKGVTKSNPLFWICLFGPCFQIAPFPHYSHHSWHWPHLTQTISSPSCSWALPSWSPWSITWRGTGGQCWRAGRSLTDPQSKDLDSCILTAHVASRLKFWPLWFAIVL
jgi:hypothetical protein